MPDQQIEAPCPPEFVAFAHRLADAAGAAIRPHYRAGVAVEVKPDQSPVTVADREAELAMRALIEELYPSHGIIGEEFGRRGAEAEYVWVLDPIDGTRAFITGRPLFGILVALVRRGRPILGIIDQPISGERWVGAEGSATTLDGAPARVRSCPELGAATLFTSAPEWFEGAREAAFLRLKAKVRMTCYNADCYAFGLLAIGFADLAIECALQPYDWCALVPVVEGAGGVISDWQGRRLGLEGDGTVVAAGDAALHQAACEVLRKEGKKGSGLEC